MHFFKKIDLFICSQREEGGRKRGRETSTCEGSIDQLPFIHTLPRNWTCNLGLCPDRDLNLQHFALQDDANQLSHTSQGKNTLKGIFLIDFSWERENHWFVVQLLCIHWLILVCPLTGNQTDNLGISGWCSNWLSYPARTRKYPLTHNHLSGFL